MGTLDLGPHEDSRKTWLENGPFSCRHQHTAAVPTMAPEEAFEESPFPSQPSLPTHSVKRSPFQNAPVPPLTSGLRASPTHQ